ncbi:MAG: LamG domain-containing protein, partial [Acidobacteriota bacterium]
MPLKARLALLGGVIALALPVLASVTVPDGDQQVYLEDFSDPATVDTGAGPSSGLDETVIDNGALRQRPGGPAQVSLSFDDPARFDFDPAAIQVSAGSARLAGSGTSQPAAYWRMEEASWSGAAGEVTDSSGNGLHGTATGDAAIDPAGVLGQAAAFGGSGSINFGQPGPLDPDPTADDFTFSAWFKTSADGAIMGKAVDSSVSRQAYLFLLNGRLAANVGGVQRSGGVSDLRDGQWHHAALVVANSASPRTFTLFVDGVEDGVFTPGNNSNGADFLLGARRRNGNTGTGFLYTGGLDEVAVFDAALSASDIQAIYGGGTAGVLGGFDDSGPSIRDTSGLDLTGVADLTGFTALGAQAALPHGFRLSPDGTQWYYFDGLNWSPAAAGESSDAAAVHANISAFTPLLTAGAERLFVDVVLFSDGGDNASIDGVRVDYIASPASLSTETLGPISVGQALDLEATILDEDVQHFVTVQVLGADAQTPIDDGELPGNAAGFGSAALQAGVALGGVTDTELYLRLQFSGAGGGLSAAVDEIRLRFDAPSTADLAVSIVAPAGPILEEEPTGFQFRVENLGPGAAENVRLLISMPTPVLADGLTPSVPETWGCQFL